MFDVILDRDGTLNFDYGYTFEVEKLVLTPNCLRGLRLLRGVGARFSVATGQSGIARGKYTEADMHKFNKRMQDILFDNGIELAAVVFCPHHPSISDCSCRKPKTGMLQQIEEKLGTVDWSNAWGIGDKPADARMILDMGGRSVLLESGSHNNGTGKAYWQPGDDDHEVREILDNKRNFVAHDLEEAAKVIIENI